MGFNFLEYCNAAEELMQAWYKHNREVLSHSGNLGYAREHFVDQILASFLPKSVIVGSGEIVDGNKGRSGQQDVIIYRADFPVITSFTPINTYLIEGVIATIEVKSNLSTGDPIGLHSAFKNAAKVKFLANQAKSLTDKKDELEKLQRKHTVKTYVIGYQGWNTKEKFVEHYINGANLVQLQGVIPDLVYLPIGCIINPAILPTIYQKDEQGSKKNCLS